MRPWKIRCTSARISVRPQHRRRAPRALAGFLAALLLSAAGRGSTEAQTSHHGPLIKGWKKSQAATFKEFDAFNRKLTHQLCRAGADHKYNKLLSDYRGKGFYLPELPDGNPDLGTIKLLLPEVKKKLAWILERADELKKERDFPGYPELTAKLQESIDRLLDIKRKARFSKDLRTQRKHRDESRNELKKLSKEFRRALKEVPFLTSYGFPVDHHANRVAFERIKGKDGTARKIQANRIFFKRRIHEDGAFDPNRTRYDLFLRTTLDTLALRLAAAEDFLPEDVRYDLEWAIGEINQQLSRGRLVHLQRMKAWAGKNEDTVAFYENLLKEPDLERAQQTAARIRATGRLKEFVLGKHADAYRLVSRQPEMIRALWVLEKILFNEVGGLDREFGLEKKDIVQVVINRKFHPYYSRIPSDDPLTPYLRKTMGKKNPAPRPWLNTLFRSGEFSFTYYYIPSVVNVFCPDRSKRGKAIQRENLEIAYELLKNPNFDFHGLRYFSRKSMTGKIDMASSWPQYVAIPERPGTLVKEPDSLVAKLIQEITERKYRYLYQFTSADGLEFDVVSMDDEIYAVRDLGGAPLIYHYRDPHAFTYFRRFFGDFSQD